jgi:DNA-binding response OmpR family regulator
MEIWNTDANKAGTQTMMPKVLVVEDSQEFQLMIKGALGRGLQLEICATLAEARQKLGAEQYDLILLDVTLPDGSGFEFCSELQSNEKSVKTPIIFLSGRNATTDKVLGLTLGAEDYVTKPFDPTELKARVESKLRKSTVKAQDETTIERGPLRMHLPNYTAMMIVAGKETKLDLTPIEYKILYRLAKNPGHILTRQQLIDNVWGVGAYIEDRSVDKHISSLRRKLGDFSNHVRTVSGLGYQFVVDPR